jgi:hypothetical protein
LDKDYFNKLEKEKLDLEHRLECVRRGLLEFQMGCTHDWLDVVYSPIYLDNKRWTSVGILSSESCQVDQWRRTCKVCKFTQATTKSRAICRKEPVFE